MVITSTARNMASFTEKLIEHVKNYKILYDMCEADYKNIRKKNQVWDEIGTLMEMNGDELKKKWKNLRDAYAKYLRSRRTRTGQAANSAARYKAWQWAQHMEYFRPFLQFGETESNVSNENTSSFSDNEESSAETEHESQENSPHTSMCKTKKRRKEKEPSSVDKVLSYLNTTNGNKHTQDELDLTFSGYAATVKKFDRKRQTIVKFKIAKLLMEEELAQMNEDMSSSTTNSTSDGPASLSVLSPECQLFTENNTASWYNQISHNIE